jgi:hypothetical protein
MLNLILGILWLGATIALFTHEIMTGEVYFRIRYLNISFGWLLLLLAGWNFARWYSARAWRAEQEAIRIAHEARLRQARHRERPIEPDPTFDFSDKPAPPRNNIDVPPSNN